MKVKAPCKPVEAAVGAEHEEVQSFEKALVYCWRACIYFMPPQIVGKGRADSVAVIREVEREGELSPGELLRSDTHSPPIAL